MTLDAEDIATIRSLIREELAAGHGAPREHQHLLRELSAVYGRQIFTSADLVATATGRSVPRPGLQSALLDALHGAQIDARRVGMLLRNVADGAAVADGFRLEAFKSEAGSKLWGLRGT